jgi:hypothetical protein
VIFDYGALDVGEGLSDHDRRHRHQDAHCHGLTDVRRVRPPTRYMARW